MDHYYDAIVVGGRPAGAATAMLLARGGMRVLVVEAARLGADTLSTHALMRGGVLQLHRWGLLDAVVDAGTPAIRSTEFAYGDDEVETVDIRPSGGISALYAPRRTVLDPLLLEAARVAGAEVRIPARVTRVLTDDGRVHGVEGIERGTGIRFRATGTRRSRGLSTRRSADGARNPARSSTATSRDFPAITTTGCTDRA
jgi:flavin-dependent dehydrogenase